MDDEISIFIDETQFFPLIKIHHQEFVAEIMRPFLWCRMNWRFMAKQDKWETFCANYDT